MKRRCLAADPGERRNLADAHPEKVQELRARYQSLADQAAPPKLEPRDPNFKTPKVWGEAVAARSSKRPR